MLRSNTHTQQQQQPEPTSVAQACPAALRGTANSKQQVNSGFQCKQFVPERHVQNRRNDISAHHDRAQWERVRRRQNDDYYENCVKAHEAKGPLELIAD